MPTGGPSMSEGTSSAKFGALIKNAKPELTSFAKSEPISLAKWVTQQTTNSKQYGEG